MKAGYEHGFYFILVKKEESGAGLRNGGYHIAKYEKETGTILMVKRRLVNLTRSYAIMYKNLMNGQEEDMGFGLI